MRCRRKTESCSVPAGNELDVRNDHRQQILHPLYTEPLPWASGTAAILSLGLPVAAGSEGPARVGPR